MMILGGPLTFYKQGQMCTPLQVEKSFSQYVLKTIIAETYNVWLNFLVRIKFCPKT